MLYRIATSPKLLGWTPPVFWAATMAEFAMALEGLSGDVGQKPFISREEVRRLALAHGKKPSLRTDPRATIMGAST